MKGTIKINADRCKACLLCVKACPAKLISQGSRINRMGYFIVDFNNKDGKCTACTLCAAVCPDAAIEVFALKEKETCK